jgi:hypothetical protein
MNEKKRIENLRRTRYMLPPGLLCGDIEVKTSSLNAKEEL